LYTVQGFVLGENKTSNNKVFLATSFLYFSWTIFTYATPSRIFGHCKVLTPCWHFNLL